MKKYFLLSLLFFCGILYPQQKKESILDKISHVDTILYTVIPDVPRKCDGLNLKKQKINAGDCNLYVEEEGSGIPIVLINGGPGGTHHYFHPWFSEASKFARVIYYDQRGCGLSDFNPGKDGYSADQAINDLDAIRKALKIDKWIVLGYSYGGFLAQYYTTKHPQNTAALILVGASPNIEIEGDDSREDMFITKEENARLNRIRKELNDMFKAGKINREKYVQLLIYNNNLNADWKRQNFYKPSKEEAAQIALYEWVNDTNFNSIMSNSAERIDLTGAFSLNPVPTLILEGKWDLTWSENKKEALKKNHPNSKMIVFENSAHGIYNEEPDKFFSELKKFALNLPAVNKAKLNNYIVYLAKREKEIKSAPKSIIHSLNWGMASSKTLVAGYNRDWLKGIKESSDYFRVGFALYDMANYKEALYVFEQMERAFAASPDTKAVSIIWQGHMLDLMGKRDDAVARYKIVYGMNLDNTARSDQYGLRFNISPYAKERMSTPFVRVENNATD